MPTGGLDVAAGSALADTLGTGLAGALGTAALGAEAGAGIGGLESAVSGNNVLKGAEKGGIGGAITGGGIGLGGDLLGGSLGAVGADALGGAAGGTLASLATGGKPLTGALEGAASGGLAGALSPSMPSTTSSSGTGVSGPIGGAPAAPVGVTGGGGDAVSDFTKAESGYSNLPLDTGATQVGDVASQLQSTGDLGSGTTSASNIGSGNTPTNVGSGLTSEFAKASGVNTSLNSSGLDALTASEGATPAAATPTSVDNFLSKPGIGSAFDVVKANPGAAIAAAGVGLDALKGNKQSGAEKNINAEASQLGQQGAQLEGYLQSGSLPPGLQQGINQASDSAKASIRSQYAAKGMSGSSAEQQDLAAVDQRAQAQASQMAEQLLTTGINETGSASQLYQSLLGDSLKNDASLSSAVSNFASSLAGGGQSGRGGITVNYSGNA